MDSCNLDAKDCLDDADAKLISCGADDSLCHLEVLQESEACMTNVLDCISGCVAEMEDTLKGAD